MILLCLSHPAIIVLLLPVDQRCLRSSDQRVASMLAQGSATLLHLFENATFPLLKPRHVVAVGLLVLGASVKKKHSWPKKAQAHLFCFRHSSNSALYEVYCCSSSAKSFLVCRSSFGLEERADACRTNILSVCAHFSIKIAIKTSDFGCSVVRERERRVFLKDRKRYKRSPCGFLSTETLLKPQKNASRTGQDRIRKILRHALHSHLVPPVAGD